MKQQQVYGLVIKLWILVSKCSGGTHMWDFDDTCVEFVVTFSISNGTMIIQLVVVNATI